MIIRGRTATVLLVVLVISLALNFFAGGLVVAGLRVQRAVAAFDRTIAGFGERFPPEIRRAVAGELIAAREAVFKALDELRAARADMFAAMQATPFDRARLDRAMEQVRAKTTALQVLGQAALAAAIAAAPPDSRVRIKPPER